MFKKSFWGIVASLALTVQTSAQDVYKNNIDFTFGGGLQTSQMEVKEGGKNNPRFGWNFNTNFRHMFGEHWGLGTGLGLGFYKSKIEIDDLQISNTIVHPHNGHSYENKAQFNNWEESQRLLDLEVPLAIYFMTPVGYKWDFIADVGGKLMIPFWSSYHVNNGDLDIRGYFEDYTNIEYYDLPKHGFSKYHNYYGKSDIKPITVAAFADAGFMYRMKGNSSLYLGAYFSKSILNLSEKRKEKLFNGKEYTGIASSNLVEETSLMAAGVKIGFSFGYPKMKEDTVIYGRPVAVYPYNDPELETNKARIEPTDEEREKLRSKKLQKLREDSIRQEQQKQQLLEQEKAQIKKANTSIRWLNNHLNIIFYKNKAVVELNMDNDEHLKQLGAFIKEYPNKVIKVTGHSSNLGKEELNMAMGKKRAEAVKEALMENGVPEKNIKVYSKGAKEPIAPNDTEANRKKNQRVVLSIE